MSWFKRKQKSIDIAVEEVVREKITHSFEMSIDFQKIVNARGIVQYKIMGASMPTSDHTPREYGHYDYNHIYLCGDNPYDFYVYVPKKGHTYYSIGQIIECYEFDHLCEQLHKAQMRMNFFRDYIDRITNAGDDVNVRFTVKG